MKYADGTEIRMGDRVRLYSAQTGIVVASVDTDEYLNEFPKEGWADYLKRGVMVKADNGALIHLAYTDTNDPEEIVRIP